MYKFLYLPTILSVFILSALLSIAHSQDNTGSPTKETEAQEKRATPEKDTGKSKSELVRAKKYMIVTANAHATRAGNQMLAAGGSAVDAMIAAQLVLNLVEPQSSGIGGGAFLVHWDQDNKKLLTYDGRETAPASVKSDHFLDKDGKPLGFAKAIGTGLAIGIPGLVKLLEHTHKKHGKLPWKQLFEPAITLSEKGFPVSPRLNKLLSSEKAETFGQKARSYFYDEAGQARPVGFILKNPEFAATLKLIANDGAKVFYQGEISKSLVQTVDVFSKGKNGMALTDLSSYEVKERAPVCVKYRKHKVCGMGPPSSGAHTIGMVLKLIEPYNLRPGVGSHQVLHLIAEAQKLAYADRNRYMADTDFVPMPSDLLNKNYLEKRRKLIKLNKATAKAMAGQPEKKQGMYGRDATVELPGTSHISIIDAKGNAVSLTTTIESGFGSRIMAGGFLLNNELTDFSFKPADDSGVLIANRIEGGKRPRSSMSPTIVFDEKGEVVLVVGSPGGSRIILYVLKTIIAMIDWGMDQQAAVELANFGSRNGPFEMESPGNTMTKLFLQSFGHVVKVVPMTSGLHVILKSDGIMYSGVDPRREGMALGE